ncbi:hypothetical protein GGQ88_001962 [Novosphingobium hassiacum]|uniref:Uncharacterized protein n=1 Tax=Novosphingobium hassiacum TaxID=173676 RepID=A0A7W5ZVF9_9SPHN|nr:hypothetical protein [Novosphingobium hassiacum]MBB3860693.1 hypothetical protein [Novosphingobium hassiacum]
MKRLAKQMSVVAMGALAMAQSSTAQVPVGHGAYHVCVVSHDAASTFFASKLSTGADASNGEQLYARFLAWLVKQGKASASDAGNCYFKDDAAWITGYVEHLDDGCENCSRWTIIYTEWTPETP